MQKILNHFKKRDLILYSSIIKQRKNIRRIRKVKPENYFYHLCRSIICQQLSEKAGDVIFDRFSQLFPDKILEPKHILSLPHGRLRSVGMSHAKARYLRNLAEHISNGNLNILHLDSKTDEEVISELTKVKGIGPWTAEMFLMFTLGRENVFSFGDLGLRRGLMKIYGYREQPTKKQIENIVAKWSPYKTYACRILWASLK